MYILYIIIYMYIYYIFNQQWQTLVNKAIDYNITNLFSLFNVFVQNIFSDSIVNKMFWIIKAEVDEYF